MGNIDSRETEREQEERKCRKESTRNNYSQDEIRANWQKQLIKLNTDIEKAIEGQFNGEELRFARGSPNEANVQGAADTDANQEEECLIAQLLRQIDDLTKDVNKCKEQERKKKAQYDYVCTEKEEMVDRIQHLETQLEQVRDEKRMLLNRLSEIGPMRLNDNNSNITDISDVNRPLNLVEQFSNLYGDLWTDTFQILQEQMQMNETDSIHLLLKSVQMVFEICKEHARSQNLYLQDAILKYTGLNEQNRDEIVVKEAVKTVREYRQKNFMYSMEKICKYVQIKLMEELPKKRVQQIASFTKECTRICWLMSIQDTPMFLSFGQVRNIAEGGPSTFDNTCFVSYTCTGMYVDFVVWPALFFCEGGALLRKGVAQGTNNPSVGTKTVTALNATENIGSSNENEGPCKRRGDKPSLFKRVTGKFIREKQKGREKEKELNKIQNFEDQEEEINNGEDNFGQNIDHVNPATDDSSSSNSITHEMNNVGLSTKTNISQMEKVFLSYD